MGKAAREAHRLQDMANIAADLDGLATRPYIVAGIEVQAVGIRHQLGPTQGAAIIFHMADGTTHPPAIIDIVGLVNLIAGTSGVFSQGPAVPEPLADAADDTPDSTPETATASGLILP